MTETVPTNEPREKSPAELKVELQDLKRVLFARAPLFVKMRALMRREVVAELAAKQPLENTNA